ncbi:MAG: hypothetical protein HYR85_23740 [Planctomycetes bacterium]|nr:hypothetical protein [Planctomycetota bacterium]
MSSHRRRNVTNVRRDLAPVTWVRSTVRRFAAAAAFGLVLLAAGCPAGNGKYIATTGGGGTPQPLQPIFSSLQSNIFTPRCALSGCHGGGGTLGLSLDPDVSYSNLVNKPSVERPDLKRVNPGSPDTSYMVKKIEGATDIVGARMPLNGPPFLTSAQIAAIRQWIQNGALDDRAASLAGPQPEPASLRLARAAGRVARTIDATNADDSSAVIAESRESLVAGGGSLRNADRHRLLGDALQRAARIARHADARPLVELADALEFADGDRETVSALRRAARIALAASRDETLAGAALALTAEARLSLAGEMERDRLEARVASLLARAPHSIAERARAAEALAWTSLALHDEGLAREARDRIASLAIDAAGDDEESLVALLDAWNARRLLPFDEALDGSFEPLAARLLRERALAGEPPSAALAAAAIAAWRPESLALEPKATGWQRRSAHR